MTRKEVEMDEDREFEYVVFIIERLIDILGLNFLMITAVISIISLLVKFVDINLSKFLIDNIFMTAGILFWSVALVSIIVVHIQIKPISIINSSSWGVPKQYERFERRSYDNRDLNIISNYVSMCLLVTGLSFFLFIFGIIEAGVRKVHNTGISTEVINSIILIILLYAIGLFFLVKIATGYWNKFKGFKYRIKEKYGCWRWDPLMQYHHEWLWMNGFDYRILEYLENHDEQTTDEISSNLLTSEERVRQRINILTDNNMIDQFGNYHSLSYKGHKFLYGYLKPWEL